MSDQEESKATVVLRMYKEPLHDRAFYPKEGVRELKFFDVPVGGKVPRDWKSEPKSECDTSLADPNRLGQYQEFMWYGIRIHMDEAWDEKEIARIRSGLLKIELRTAIQWGMDVPLIEIPIGRHAEDFEKLYRLVTEFGVDPKKIKYYYDITIKKRPVLLTTADVLDVRVVYDRPQNVDVGGLIHLMLLGVSRKPL